MSEIPRIYAEPWADYELLDAGGGKKLTMGENHYDSPRSSSIFPKRTAVHRMARARSLGIY